MNDSLSAKSLVRLIVDEDYLDHHTLTEFRYRIEKDRGGALLEELPQEVILMAMHGDVEFEVIQMMDSTHALPDVNVAKNDHRNREGKPRRHRAARWGMNTSSELYA